MLDIFGFKFDNGHCDSDEFVETARTEAVAA